MSHLATLTGPCPVCAGGKVGESGRPCTNCGGQTMNGIARGTVPLRPDGEPCRHEYRAQHSRRGASRYECAHCGDSYSLDSGD